MTTVIRFNWLDATDRFRFLSNFYPTAVLYEGWYPSAEHAFQAMKTLGPDDRAAIRNAPTASQAKKLGRRVKLRSDWEDIKLDVMLGVIRAKFSGPLRNQLLDTGDAKLIEYAPWGDRFWGVDSNGLGQNHLGKILMQVRDEIREQI